jgi:rod shape-determining protein MreC
MRYSPPTPRPGLALFTRSSKRIQYAAFVLLSLVLIVLGRLNHPLIDELHGALAFVVTPVIVAFDAASEAAVNVVSWVQGLAVLEGENGRLREENSRLQQWRAEAERLANENRRLQELLNVRPTFVPTLVTARVLSVTGGVYSRSVLVHAGTDDGVKVGLPVVDENGLVGRTIRVGARASRVLLTTDVNSRIPVQLARSKQNAIAVGRNGELLALLYLPPSPDVAVGDVLVTSGHGGMFPADLMVGTVASIEDGKILVEPSANLGGLDFVRFLDYATAPLEPKVEE